MSSTQALCAAIAAGNQTPGRAALPAGPDLLRADRAGRRGLGHPRHRHRRPHRQPGDQPGRPHRASTGSRRSCGPTTPSPVRRSTAPSSSTNEQQLQTARGDGHATTRSRWPAVPPTSSTRPATSKITGEEERYSNTDFIVFQANVDGAMEVFNLLQPYLQAGRSRTGDPDQHAVPGGGEGHRAVQGHPGLRQHRATWSTPPCSTRSAARSRRRSRPSPRRCRRCRGRSPEPWPRTDRSLAGPLSRRRLLGGLGLAGTGLALGGGAIALGSRLRSPEAAADADSAADRTYPFYGEHQAGIVTPAQDRLAFASMNVLEGTTRSDLRDAAAGLDGRGRADDPGPARRGRHRPRRPSARHRRGHRLTGGRAHHHHRLRPVALRRPVRAGRRRSRPCSTDLPALPNENLDPDYVGGDLCIQACSDDPLVAFHAVRNLARLGLGVVDYNWMELGFGKTSSTSTAQATPRNLLGFKDGTRNIKAQQTDLLDDYVWVGNETRPALDARRQLPGHPPHPDLHRELGPRLPRGPAERHRPGQGDRGAAERGRRVHHTRTSTQKNDQGQLVIPADAHIRLASHEENDGTRHPAPGLLLHRRHRSRCAARCSAGCSSSPS